MRVARRGSWDGSTAALAAMLVVIAAGPTRAEAPPVRLTVEVAWGPGPGAIVAPQSPEATGATIEVTGGRVVDALAWAANDDVSAIGMLPPPEAEAGGAWRLGSGPAGRARARLEAPIDASITVRAGATTWTVPLLSLLDGPRRSPIDGGTLIEARRLDWDPLEIQVAGDGTVAPGTVVPVTIGVNVLAPEPTEVELSLAARLRPIRGDRPVWEDSRRLVIPTNSVPAPAQTVTVPMPIEEGTYVLELAASWAPRELQGDGTRLGRWWRRLRHRSTDSATRRISLAVVGPVADRAGTPAPMPPMPPRRRGPERADTVVDVAELGRPRGLRPRPEGRAPAEASSIDSPWAVPAELLVEPPRRERIWSLLGRVGSDFRPVPTAGPDGLSWTAAPMKVSRPDRPHRLDLAVVVGDPAALSVALIAPGRRPRMLLDARGSGPITSGGGPATVLSWPIWPDATDPVLVVVNRSPDRPLWLGDAKLFELADDPTPLPLLGPPPDGGRKLAVRMTGPGDLERFGGASDAGPDDPVALGRNLAAYLGMVGASAVVLPADPADRPVRGALDGQADEDPIGPDRREALLAGLARRGLATIIEVPVDGVTLPGLPPPGSEEAEARGLARLDRSGRAGVDRPSYNLLRPEVQRAMTRHVVASLGGPNTSRAARPDGVLIRLGPGATLPGRPDAGIDDATYERFVREAIKDEVPPGLDPDDPARFTSRHEYLTGPASVPWLSWRSRRVGSYYVGLAAAVAEAVPGATLMIATPGLDDGQAGAEARRFDRDGQPPDAAWRAIGLDLADWPRGDGPTPVLLRGAGLGLGDLEHDLATHPALDAQLQGRSGRGLLIGLDDRPARSEPGPAELPPTLRLSAAATALGPEGDELLGHALAAFDAGWVVMSSPALVGQEARFRRFARVYRALPAPGSEPPGSAAVGAIARSRTVGDRTYVSLANDTPFPVRLTSVVASPTNVAIEDLGRGFLLDAEAVPGGRRVTLDLPPFGVAALRVGASGARLASVVAAYDGRREAHRMAVVGRLQALASGGSIAHLNPGFEPDSVVRRASSDGDSEALDEASGWSVEGAADASVAIDLVRPRSGRGSLLLTAPVAPAAASSPAFLPPGPLSTLRAHLRTDPPGAPVRIRIETEPDAARPVHLAADLPDADRGEWSAVALRAPGLPTDGVTPLRLRFELRSPGRLWVDDLSLTGSGLAQARSCLTAALQALDEGRVADFARLARSHWVVEAGGPIAAESPPPPLGSPLAGEISTDLPERSRLR